VECSVQDSPVPHGSLVEMRTDCSPNCGRLPTVEQVVAYCTTAVIEAATTSWPDQVVTLAEHVPSVTGYVQRIEVGGRDLYAKVSLLGVSLVSILRGRYGCWASVRLDQQSYVSDVDNLLRREAAQLRFLN